MKKFVVAGQKYKVSYYIEGLRDTVVASLYFDQNTSITKEFDDKDAAIYWVSHELYKIAGE
jgi:hypothetical protein